MTERQRILLAEFEPKIPGDPVYATWSPKDKHAEVSLSGGNLTATKSTQHATNWVEALATKGVYLGQQYWEVTVSFTGTADYCVGVNADGADVVNYQPPDTGVTRNGNVLLMGAVVGSVGASASGDVIRVWTDADAGVIRFARNNGAWVELTGISARRLLGIYKGRPCFNLLRPLGATVTLTANFGATPCVYPVPNGARTGVYTLDAPTTRTVYLSNTGLKTTAAEAPASTYYDARIAGDTDVEFVREMGLSAWDASAGARGGELSVINRDGGIDEWLAWEWRDAPYRLYSGYEGDARSAFTLWSAGVCDRIDGIDNRRMRIVLASPLTRLDVPVQNTLWPDDAANAALRGKPLPLVLGQPRWCEPQRVNTTPSTRDFRVHDGRPVPNYGEAIDSIAEAFDKGDRFAGPADPYTAHNPITLANGGNFTTWASDGTYSMPSGFTRLTGFTATDRFQQGATGTLQMLSTGQLTTAIYHSASALNAGYRYTLAFTVTAVPKGGNITFRVDAGGAAAGTRRDLVVPIATTGAKTAILDMPTAGAAQLQVLLGSTELNASIDNFTVSSVQIVDWTNYNDGGGNLIGLTLANQPEGKVTCHPVGPRFVAPGGAVVERASALLQYLRARASYDRAISFSWDATNSPAALETAIAARLATYLTAPVTYAALLRQIMDSLLGGAWVTRAGALAVARWSEPDPSAIVLTLSDTNIAGDIAITLDQAKGLRRRVSGRRNHAVHGDGDIADSVSPELRAELTSEWGSTANGAQAAEAGTDLPLSAAYLAAQDRDPLQTLLQEDVDIQTLANALCTLWRPTRYFYDLSAVLDADAADALEPGQTVRLVWPGIAGLAGGIPLRVVRARTRFWSRRVDLRLWGSAPPKTA